MKLLIKNGRVVDPSQNLDAIQDVLLENGKVKEIAKKITAKADEEIDAMGLVVAPGLIEEIPVPVALVCPEPAIDCLEAAEGIGGEGRRP